MCAIRIEAAVRDLVGRALERATTILNADRTALDDGPRRLQERETLTSDRLRAVIAPRERGRAS